MLETAFGGPKEAAVSPSADYGYAFRPPPRFEVDAAGGWAPHASQQGVSPLRQEVSSGMSDATWNTGEGNSDYGWNGNTSQGW